MSAEDRKDFDDRLAELSNWQIEQQKKLRAFQEAQKRLLDLEHQNVLSRLKTQNFDKKKDKSDKSHLTSSTEYWGLQNLRNDESDEMFPMKCESLKLKEPNLPVFNKLNHSNLKILDGFCNESVEGSARNESTQPKKFLKRGEGLARFRMTLDDFKGPPKIYKERRIKTYLNGRQDPSFKSNRLAKPVKQCTKGSKSFQPKPQNKLVPVKIFVSENKSNKCSSNKNLEAKQNKNLQRPGNMPKAALENLVLKSCNVATEWYNLMKEKEKADSVKSATSNKESIFEASVLDIESKKDEKELQIFEMLEKKIDDSSFCSTSSFVDKLMEQSLSSTPSKPSSNSLCNKPYSQGLKSLRSQFLGEQQMKKFEKFCNEELDVTPENLKLENKGENNVRDEEIIAINDIVDKKEEENCEEDSDSQFSSEEDVQEKEEESYPHKVNKLLLQEYIKDFKKFKSVLAKNAHRIEEPEEEPPIEEPLVEQPPVEAPKKEVQINHREIALKLQRKGLQDNVKNILNWECPQRKRQPKRVIKKIRPRQIKCDKYKATDKDQNEKVIFNSALLKTRLEELEKEIQIFRKENSNLEKLQKECNEERVKLSKERKEFEKQMMEEKEKFELKMAEDQKKLQKERTVFEKYCKQVKNQPTRQEREETANLKKEIEKLTETLTTKESRWGASQARLRNQVKSLEKENSQLKAEIEKYKKLSNKKVSFESERNLNTKIIHAINSELEKLKPKVVKNANRRANNQPSSARVVRHLEEKPIRRIKSVPDMKKQEEVDVSSEITNDCDERVLGSVSTDSGIDTNGSRYVRQSPLNDTTGNKYDRSKIADVEVASRDGSQSSKCDHLCECPNTKRSGGSSEGCVESAVQEALFGNKDMETINPKILEIKNRLERLKLYNQSEGKLECFSERSTKQSKESFSSCRNSESEEAFGSSIEEDDGENENDIEIIKYKGREWTRNPREVVKSPIYSGNTVIESKIKDSGIWEKIYEDGTKEINYPNGNVKKIFPGNKIVKMVYYNGDIKETDVVEGSEKYYYAESKTWHTTYKDGLEVLEFPNGQTERRHANGSTEISFPNGCVRYCDSSGKDEWRFLDGTVIKTNESGHKILLMPNGQKEIHTKEYKRREYPDGTVKILYADGTQETRYSSGRVRLKDKDGNLLMDSGGIRIQQAWVRLRSSSSESNIYEQLGEVFPTVICNP